jgi:hypothetical protein
VTLTPGSNTIMAYSVDPVGNDSATNSVAVFYTTYSTLELETNGYGSIANSARPNPLVIGSNRVVVGTNYTVKAAPDPSNLFSGWTGTITTNANPWTFTAQPNMTLTANFVTNYFIAAAGSYNGLFYVTDTSGSFDVTNGGAQSSGLLKNLTLTRNGDYSASLYIGGSGYTISGKFGVSGSATNQITRASTLGPLTLVMNLNPANKPAQVTGTVQSTNSGGWTASLQAEPAATRSSPDEYALLIPPTNNAPAGYGCVLIASDAEGTATVTGHLADGTAFSETAAISQTTSNLPVYAAFGTNGVLLGKLSLASGVPEGNLTWIRPAVTNGVFTSGFTNILTVAQSELWTNPPAGAAALTCPAGQLMISNASTNLIFYVAVSTNNTLSKLGSVPTNAGSLSGTINPKTGLLSVSIGSSPGIAAAAGYGIVLQNADTLEGSNNVAGYFATATNTGLLLLQTSLSNVAPILLTQPAGGNFKPGSKIQFSIQAIGSLPLSYQWRLDGTALTNGGRISGATMATLTISNEEIYDAGSYSVVVSNTNGVITSSNAILAIQAPGVTITSPKPGFDTTNAALTVKGTANDVVTNVMCGVNGGGWTSAIPGSTNSDGTGNWSSWIAKVTLTAGSNTVMAYSVDVLGNHSPTRSNAVFYTTYSTLNLQTNGDGAIRPGFANRPEAAPTTNGLVYTNLVVGMNYTVTAVPGPTALFSNWTANASLIITNTTNTTLTFTMASNMTLTANFITNFFLEAAGVYNGLFCNPNNTNITDETAGMLHNLSLKANGTYSGKLFLAGTGYPLAGSFDLSGASAAVAGPSSMSGGQLQVGLTLHAARKRITGVVSNTLWTANLIALASNGLPSSNEYTILLTNATGSTPPGEGYALVTNHGGLYTFSGALADGTAFNQTMPASQSGDLPIYASLYGNTGLLLGWVNITNGESELSSDGLIWVKKQSASALIYPGGFTNWLLAQSSPWTDLGTNTNAISLPSGGQLTISEGSLAEPLVFSMVYTNNTFVKESVPGNSTNSIAASIAAKTGLLSVTFGNGNGTNTTIGKGAILQNQNSGAGFFVTPTNAGSIQLTP